MRTRIAAVAVLAAVTLAGLAWKERARARHLAVPLVADRSLPVPAGAELLDDSGSAGIEVARIGARITALLEDGDGALWIGTFDAGLFRADPEISAVPDLQGRERFVNAIEEHDGLVWIATQGGLIALDGDRRAITVLPGEGVTALALAHGALYAGTARGLFRVSPGAGAEPVEVAGPSGEPLRVSALAASGERLWIGTPSGAYSLPLAVLEAPLLSREARWDPLVFGNPPAQTNVVTALAPLADGAIAGTDDGGVVRLHDARRGVSALRFADARANEVNPGAAARASPDAALLGTQGGGLLLVSAGPGPDELRARRLGALGRTPVSAVRVVADGRVLVGTAAGVVLKLAGSAPEVHAAGGGEPAPVAGARRAGGA